MARTARITRTTGETAIDLSIDIDGSGASAIATGVGFFDHMLTALARHALIDMDVHVEGDTWVDDHHTVEDTGIALGQALRQALGTCAGIRRFGNQIIPLDEALVLASVDISGRGGLYWDVPIEPAKVGTFDTELAQEFFIGLAREAGITLHVRKLAGTNAHHIIEACFKACARALRDACEADLRNAGIPSTKGVL